MKTKPVNSKKKINLDEYVNINTGENLLSKFKGGTIFISDETEGVSISSNNYVILEVEMMKKLTDIFNRSELGSIMIMSLDLKTEFNLIYNNNVPHTNETLMKKLDISSASTFSLLIKKLITHGVICQVKGNIMGKSRVIYMMNPFIARKRKIVHKDLITTFEKFKIKEVEKKV